MRLVADLDGESTRAMREGLDEETLALFDLLKKPDLGKKDIERIKKVAIELLAILTRKKQESATNHWLASVRGRVGFIGWSKTLYYVTGGAAWASTEIQWAHDSHYRR